MIQVLTVLVVITVIRGRNLPSETSIASLVVSVGSCLGVEDSLGEGQPARSVRWRVGERELGSKHSRHAPETLIVVSEGQGNVTGLVVVIVTSLELHGLNYLCVVGRIAGALPVVHIRPPHGTAFPPVVVTIGRRTRENTRNTAWVKTMIVLDQVGGELLGRLLDVIWSGTS